MTPAIWCRAVGGESGLICNDDATVVSMRERKVRRSAVKRLIAVIIAFMFLFFSGCSERKAKETFETARFEELQKNFTHARELYREIIEKYPNSEYAAQAAERLKELDRK